MKKFLNDLKNELKKLNVAKSEIEEIMEDHEQMITTAMDEGLKESELASKFGNPSQLASDLANQLKGVNTVNKTMDDGFEVLFEKQAMNIVDVSIKLVSEDITVVSHKEDTIKVYGKNVKNRLDYEIYFDKDEFELHHTKSKGLNYQEHSDVRFKVFLPESKRFEKVKFQSVNGDLSLDTLEAKKIKIKSTNGDSKVNNVNGEDTKVTTVNGDLKISSVQGESLQITLISGDASIEEITVSDDIKISSVSGDVKIKNAESLKGKLRTVSGDMNAVEFYPDTLSVQSVSGDITITNEDKSRPIHVKSNKSLQGDVTIS